MQPGRGRRSSGLTRRHRRLLVRLALAAAVVALIVARYTSPRSLFNPVTAPDTRVR